MAQSSKSEQQEPVAMSRALQDVCAQHPSLPNVSEDVEMVLVAAILAEMSHKEHGQAWQKPDEVKRVEG